jgi:hypothetical protein
VAAYGVSGRLTAEIDVAIDHELGSKLDEIKRHRHRPLDRVDYRNSAEI